MSIMLTVGEIKKATKGKLLQGESSTLINGVSIDSRCVAKKNIFVAIQGKKFDGHNFIRRAIRNGATAVVVSKNIACSKYVAVIFVEDTTKALGHIAGWYRRQFNIPIVAITGSVGKTTTKELTASILAKRFKVLKNVKTENNQYGVALTLLKLKASHTMAVLELGSNQPGDIRWLAQMVRPTTVIFTNIGASHLAKLKNPRGVFQEKVQLIKYTDPQGTIIYNGDDRYLRAITKKKYSQRIISYGCENKVDNKSCRMIVHNNRKLQFQLRGHRFMLNSPVYHNVYNALAAISCGLLYKIRYNDIHVALEGLKFHNARQEIIKCGRFWVIDDTYNANPLSLRSAINTLDTLKVQGKRIVVCADMLELGSQSKVLHESAGRMIAQSAVDVVLTVGRDARYIIQSLNRFNGCVAAQHCDTLSEVHRRLKGLFHPGDAALVKGSRGMRMERTVAFLKKYFK